MKEADNSSKIVYSISIDRSIEGYAFRGFHYVIAMVQFFLLGILYDLYFDTLVAEGTARKGVIYLVGYPIPYPPIPSHGTVSRGFTSDLLYRYNVGNY